MRCRSRSRCNVTELAGEIDRWPAVKGTGGNMHGVEAQIALRPLEIVLKGSNGARTQRNKAASGL
jgi:hypothetical protein